MDRLTTCYKTIVFVGDSRVKNLYPSHEWLGDPPQFIYDYRKEAKIDIIINMVEEKLNELSEINLLVVILGLHSDLTDLIPSSEQKQSEYTKRVLEGIIQKISLTADKWKILYGNAKFLWCLPCIPDFKRLGCKSRNKQYIPYDEQDVLVTHQVRSYFKLVREFKQLWENYISTDFDIVDLNIVFNDNNGDKSSFYHDFEDSRKLPNFNINHTVDGLHPSLSMAPIFWRYLLSTSQPTISDVEIVKQLKNKAESKHPSFIRKSPRLSKKHDYDFASSKDEGLEPIIDVFPLAEDDIDSESWIKEELGIVGGDGVEETLAISVLEGDLLKVFDMNGRNKELWRKIPGLSYIIGIKPDNVSTSNMCKYDCVMCSYHNGSVTLTNQELKIHIQSKQHVMNVMEFEVCTDPHNIIPATENTYTQEREKAILRLMDDLSAQVELNYNYQKEKEMTPLHIPLHINSVVRKCKRITTKNKDNNVSSVVKKRLDGDISTDTTGFEKGSIEPIKLTICAKGPGIVPEVVLHTVNENKIDQKNVDRRNVKGKEESSSSVEIEYPKLPMREYSLLELKDVHKFFCVPLLSIKNKQKNRIQNNIVIMTDDKENFDVHLANFNEKVTVVKVPDLHFGNAFEIVKTHPNFGKGTLFIFSCGNHDIIQKELLSDCVLANCPTPQTIYTLPTTIPDLLFLSKKALDVHLQILESTQNDIALFCGIYQVKIITYNRYTNENRPCLENHPVDPLKQKVDNEKFQSYARLISLYDQFAVYHAQALGYKSWNLPISFCLSERPSLREFPIYLPKSNCYSYCPAIHKRNGNMAKKLCKHLLHQMANKNENEDLMDISSDEEPNFEQIAIIADSRYLPYMSHINNTMKKICKIIVVEGMKIGELRKYIPNDIEYVSKKTLYLIVVGIHSITTTAPAKSCLDLNCETFIQSLNPMKKWNQIIKKIPVLLKYHIEEIKVTLPKGSDIAILPPLPIKLIGHLHHGQHQILHVNQIRSPLSKYADKRDAISTQYRGFMNEIFDVTYLSLLKITKRVQEILDLMRNNPDYVSANVVQNYESSGRCSYKYWQRKVLIMIKILYNSDVYIHLDTATNSKTNGSHMAEASTSYHSFEASSNDIGSHRIVEYDYQAPPPSHPSVTSHYMGALNMGVNMNQYRTPAVNWQLPDFTLPPPLQQPFQPSTSNYVPNIEHTHTISSFQSSNKDFSYRGINETTNDIINRDLDEIIQFTNIIQNSNKISKFPGGLSQIFSKAYIVGAKAVVNLLLDCNIKTTIINHNFSDFEENDFHLLLNKIGNPQQKSVCCLVFNISTVLATRLEMSSGCSTYSCKPPLYISTLQRESLSIPGVMDEINSYTSNQLLRISRFIRRLSQLLPVVILPLTPTRIYCEDIASNNHQIGHIINSLGYPVARGSQAFWQKTIQSLVLSWNTLMEVTNRNYDHCNYTSSYIASNPRTFLVLDNINNFIAHWLEPDVWKAFAEAFLMSLVPMKVNFDVNDLGHQSKMVQVTVAQISPSIPPNYFEELFYTADSNVIIIKEKEKYVLKGMSVGKADLIVKKLNHYHVGDTVLTASTVNGASDVYEFSLMQSLFILAGFEKVYRKYKPEIIQNLMQKINEFPDVATLKSTPCTKGPACRGHNQCYHYHSPLDKRRNPFLYTYKDALCSKSQTGDGLCQDGIRCDFSHNVYELKFHPFKYQVRLCPSGESAASCNKRDVLCNYAHKDSPEMFYINEWEDIILFGPHHALDYFTGAIRSASKIKNLQQCNFKVILLSPSIEFLDVAVEASGILIQKFGLNVCSLETNIDYIASSQILVGNPSSFCNLGAGFFDNMQGAIIVEDIQNILKNERLRVNMQQSFEIIRSSTKVFLNKVFVSATYEYGLSNTISEVIGLPLKQLEVFSDDVEVNQSFAMKRASLSGSLSQRLGSQPSKKESTLESYPTMHYSHQKRSRSRSPSPVSAKRKQHHYTSNSSIDRSRSPSPLFSKSHTELRIMAENFEGFQDAIKGSTGRSFSKTNCTNGLEVLDNHEKCMFHRNGISISSLFMRNRLGKKLFEEYSLALEKMRQDFEGEFSVYNSMPELYPDYENFYTSFVEMYNMQHKGKSSEHRERLWKLFWKAKVEDIKVHDWEIKKTNLIKEFDNRVLANSSACHSASSHKQGSYSFEGTIDLIDGICDDLGFLGPSVKAMLKSCRDLGLSSKEAFRMFTDSENIMLINMVLDKIKSLCQSSSGEKLQLCKKVADWIPKFLEDAKNGPSTPKSKDIIDVDAIGQASVGKGSRFAIDLIKTAIAYEGISNPSKELINELFIKVCNVHYTLSLDE